MMNYVYMCVQRQCYTTYNDGAEFFLNRKGDRDQWGMVFGDVSSAGGFAFWDLRISSCFIMFFSVEVPQNFDMEVVDFE